MSNTFTWKTKFKSIIIVDGELFPNEYEVELSLTPHTADLKEQTAYFDRLKHLFEHVFANTITTWREEKLYSVLKKNLPSIPTTIDEEIKMNIFFRFDNASIKEGLNLKDSTDQEIFSKIRDLTDTF